MAFLNKESKGYGWYLASLKYKSAATQPIVDKNGDPCSSILDCTIPIDHIPLEPLIY